MWRSVFYSAIAGWAVLLALVFAATNVPAITEKGGGSIPVIETALTSAAAKAVLLICTVGAITLSPHASDRQCVWFGVHFGLLGLDAGHVEQHDDCLSGLVHVQRGRPDRRGCGVMREDDRGPFTGTPEVGKVALHFALPLVVVGHSSALEECSAGSACA